MLTDRVTPVHVRMWRARAGICCTTSSSSDLWPAYMPTATIELCISEEDVGSQEVGS